MTGTSSRISRSLKQQKPMHLQFKRPDAPLQGASGIGQLWTLHGRDCFLSVPQSLVFAGDLHCSGVGDCLFLVCHLVFSWPVSKFSSAKDAIFRFKTHPSIVCPHLHLVAYAKTLFTREVMFPGSGWTWDLRGHYSNWCHILLGLCS